MSEYEGSLLKVDVLGDNHESVDRGIRPQKGVISVVKADIQDVFRVRKLGGEYSDQSR